jgi:hypothetical protein
VQARSSHTVTSIGDKLYLWGGEHAPRVPVGTDTYVYSLTHRRWTLLQVRCYQVLVVAL